MSDQTKPEGQSQQADHASLANSTPDDNTILMRMLRLLLGEHGAHMAGNGVRSLIMGIVATLLAGVIMMVYVLAKWGVPIVLGVQPLAEKLWGGKADEQTAEARRMADSLGKIDNRLDGIGQQQAAETKAINQLGSDVRDLRGKQSATDAKVRAMSAERSSQR